MSRLVIDAHVHAQRFAPSFLQRGESLTCDSLEETIKFKASRVKDLGD